MLHLRDETHFRREDMSNDTANLGLPYILAAQAQKHVTHNEALRMLDALVHLSVADRDLAEPPGEPAEGARFIVAAEASGAWAGKEGSIAAWQDGAWAFFAPRRGWLCLVHDEAALLFFDGSGWQAVGGGPGAVALLGINTAADQTNRLAVAAPASLFTHEGNDHRLKVNKAAAADTASLVFQSGFSGRAEIGLSGDDDWRLKVSPDGASWREAIRVDRASGAVAFPNTSLGTGGAGGGANPNLLINPGFSVNQRRFAGGTLAAGACGYDRWKADVGGAELSLTGETLTLSSGAILQVLEAPQLAGETVTLSLEDVSGGDVDVEVAGVAATITAGTGRRSASLLMPSGASGNVAVRLAPAGAPVSFRRAKLERGGTATAFHPRLAGEELALCQRYYFKTYDQETAPGTATDIGYVTMRAPTNDRPVLQRDLPVTMAPGATVTMYSPYSGAAGMIRDENAASDVDGWFLPVGQSTLAVITLNPVTVGHNFTVHLVADAEIEATS